MKRKIITQEQLDRLVSLGVVENNFGKYEYIGWFLEENYYGIGAVIGAILQDIGVFALIIDAIIIFYGIIGGTIKLIWE